MAAMTEDGHDKLVEIFFRAFPSMDGQELGAVLEEVRKLLDEELKQRCWLERRKIIGSCVSNN
jgi:hypothetical protein